MPNRNGIHILTASLVWLGNVHRRMLAVYFAVVGPRATYACTRVLATWLYRLLTPLRARSEAQCRAVLGARLGADAVARTAARSFVHRIWNLADLLLAERLLHAGTHQRYGGRIPESQRRALLDAAQRRQPVVLVSAYYGPFDLLPVFLGYNDIRAGVVYRPHDNAAFDAHRRRIRGRSGCELIPVARAGDRLAAILEAGGTVALVADHHADRRGMPATFLGLPTLALRSVALLAWRYDADVVVAGIRRVDDRFRFEVVVADVFKPESWVQKDDPVAYITSRYLRGLETIVRADPSQYLWGYARWGEDFARRVADR